MKDNAGQPWISATWDAPSNVVALSTVCKVGDSSASSDFNLAFHVGGNPNNVQHNRRRLQQHLGDRLDFQWLKQVHGTGVIEAKRDGSTPEADAVITSESDLVCCVLTADCLPVFLSSRSGRVVAVAHAGWRGLAAGVLENTVASFPVSGEQIVAWLGPAIGPCHFQVGTEVRDAFLGASGEESAALESCFSADREPGKYHADLYGLATAKLTNLGVEVSGGGYCTYCESDRFYSYRRQRNTGRMASLIYRKS